jgi:glycosyltransferase involved in cell wall biosynthesis
MNLHLNEKYYVRFMKNRKGLRKIVIVLAVFNPNILFLKSQIQSIMDQSEDNWICLIGDDASTSNWLSEIEPILDDRFRIFAFENNVGVYFNVERLLKQAIKLGPEYIFFSDQDDLWHQDKLSKLTKFFESGISIVHSNARIINEIGEVVEENFHAFEKTDVLKNSVKALVLKNSITGCLAAVNIETARLAIPFPSSKTMEHDLWLAISALQVGRMAYCKETLVDYRTHSNNLIGPRSPKYIFEFLNPRQAITAFLVKNGIRQTLINEIDLDPFGGTQRRESVNRHLTTREKLYLLNFKAGKLLVMTHDIPFTLKIRVAKMGLKLGRIRRILRFCWKVVSSTHFRNENIAAIKNIESRAHYSSGPGLTYQEHSNSTQSISAERVDSKSAEIIMLLPTLSRSTVFGGVASALKLACALAKQYPVSICVVNEEQHDQNEKSVALLAETLDVDYATLLKIINEAKFKAGDFGDNDIILGTAWWTVNLAKQVRRDLKLKKLSIWYLVQDFEPLFYPASDTYAEALSSYYEIDQLIVNSKINFENSIFDNISLEAIDFLIITL